MATVCACGADAVTIMNHFNFITIQCHGDSSRQLLPASA